MRDAAAPFGRRQPPGELRGWSGIPGHRGTGRLGCRSLTRARRAGRARKPPRVPEPEPRDRPGRSLGKQQNLVLVLDHHGGNNEGPTTRSPRPASRRPRRSIETRRHRTAQGHFQPGTGAPEGATRLVAQKARGPCGAALRPLGRRPAGSATALGAGVCACRVARTLPFS